MVSGLAQMWKQLGMGSWKGDFDESLKQCQRQGANPFFDGNVAGVIAKMPVERMQDAGAACSRPAFENDEPAVAFPFVPDRFNGTVAG